jgi:uncharacterized membrane protein (UPF0127 family)
VWGEATTLAGMVRVCLLLLIVLIAGCDSGVEDPTFGTVATTTVATTTVVSTSSPSIPGTLADFAVATVSLDGEDLLVAVAGNSEERRRGLMGVTDLGDLDGMLFVFDQDVSAAFWMKDTLIPLDIAFFTATGDLVDGFAMEPCTANPCPTYRPDGSYRYALEMPAGAMPGRITHLTVDG